MIAVCTHCGEHAYDPRERYCVACGHVEVAHLERCIVEGPDYRTPRVVGTERYHVEIQIGGRTMYQQAPPCHAPGAVYDVRVAKVVARGVSEAEAQRMYLRLRLAPVADELRDQNLADVAERLGMTPLKVAKRRMKASRR